MERGVRRRFDSYGSDWHEMPEPVRRQYISKPSWTAFPPPMRNRLGAPDPARAGHQTTQQQLRCLLRGRPRRSGLSRQEVTSSQAITSGPFDVLLDQRPDGLHVRTRRSCASAQLSPPTLPPPLARACAPAHRARCCAAADAAPIPVRALSPARASSERARAALAAAARAV